MTVRKWIGKKCDPGEEIEIVLIPTVLGISSAGSENHVI